MICGLVLKYLNMPGLVMIGRYETTLPCTSQFTLTLPLFGLIGADGRQTGGNLQFFEGQVYLILQWVFY